MKFLADISGEAAGEGFCISPYMGLGDPIFFSTSPSGVCPPFVLIYNVVSWVAKRATAPSKRGWSNWRYLWPRSQHVGVITSSIEKAVAGLEEG
jgi:hypothetical protein